MNQSTNLIQWKNLTKEQQEGFDFEHGDYEIQSISVNNDWRDFLNGTTKDFPYCNDTVFRLKIVDDEWYYCEWNDKSSVIRQGNDSQMASKWIANCVVVRPAKPSEIPKPILHGEDLVGYLCGVSDVSIEDANASSTLTQPLMVIASYSQSGYGIAGVNLRWKHAYPVPADKIKQLKNLGGRIKCIIMK